MVVTGSNLASTIRRIHSERSGLLLMPGLANSCQRRIKAFIYVSCPPPSRCYLIYCKCTEPAIEYRSDARILVASATCQKHAIKAVLHQSSSPALWAFRPRARATSNDVHSLAFRILSSVPVYVVGKWAPVARNHMTTLISLVSSSPGTLRES
jgi:hypothetical protein